MTDHVYVPPPSVLAAFQARAAADRAALEAAAEEAEPQAEQPTTKEAPRD